MALGDIPYDQMFFAIRIGQATRPIGPHKTPFIGTTFDVDLLVKIGDDLFVTDPVSGARAPFAPDAQTRVHKGDHVDLDAIWHHAGAIDEANSAAFATQALLMTHLGTGIQSLCNLFCDRQDSRHRDSDDELPVICTNDGELVLTPTRASFVQRHKIEQETVRIGNSRGSFFNGLIDYTRRVMWIPGEFAPIVDCPGLDFRRRVVSLLDEVHPGIDKWALVAEGANPETIAAARAPFATSSVFIKIRPDGFQLPIIPDTAPPYSFKARVVGEGVLFEPRAKARSLDIVKKSHAITCIPVFRTIDGQTDVMLNLANDIFIAAAANPEFGRALAKALGECQELTAKAPGPLKTATFNVYEGMWNDPEAFETELIDLLHEKIATMALGLAEIIDRLDASDEADTDEPPETPPSTTLH